MISPSEHRELARWAAACALPAFEAEHPDDPRPRAAIAAARAWANGAITVQAAREIAFLAHAAARESTGPAADAAARAAGHAAATAHLATHAPHAADYAARAASDAADERCWQRSAIGAELHAAVSRQSQRELDRQPA
ncbi:putative immunity protein [Yonghaparkia sp. Root332]|uniref:putative immunity protein n=1 Tax=Yonghaparkia sp. Root332 TaxID=1736516 RepID=UPI0006F6FF9E|nr:hypothetical protein [Yonghaparkia sp. Root332]KQV24552.1 hypothetical protein ASC54_08430 [Yonghaparkia sp. Root332]